MSSTLLPFLYQTRTIQRAWRQTIPSLSATAVRYASSNRRQLEGGSIPFDWAGQDPDAQFGRDKSDFNDITHRTLQKKNKLTLSPSEAHVFKRIFEEIAEGKMPLAKTRRRGADQQLGDGAREGQTAPSQAQSLVEHARMSEFREKYLERFPQSLRTAASKAMGMFELQPTGTALEAMSEEDKKLWAERVQYRQLREEEKRRVEGLMRNCRTDFDLWEVMQTEVFTLPERLGLTEKPSTPAPAPAPHP